MATFPGFAPEALKFLRELKENNDREWFAPRKAFYEERLRLPMIELVGAVHLKMQAFAPQYVGDPAKCVFRIYRDTRFSKDKTPYKTHIAASFGHNALDKGGAGYYFAVSPESVDIGGGLYSPDPATLLAVRRRISERPDDYLKAISSAQVKKLLGGITGELAARPPRGFAADEPAIEHIRRKQHVFFTHLDPAIATTAKLQGEIVKRFEAMTPLIAFLNR